MGQPGATNFNGTVFKLNKDGTGHTDLHTFTGPPGDGSLPTGPLVQGSGGMLYGTTLSGGSSGVGTVFKLHQDGSGYSIVLSFSASLGDGWEPVGLVQGSDGTLYGTMRLGGLTNANIANGLGTIFKLNKDGIGYAVLRRFTGASGDGIGPTAVLVEGSDGVLYGTTAYGGIANASDPNGRGTVFKLNKDGSGYTVLHGFAGAGGDGAYPWAALVEGKDGALYGTTGAGGRNNAGTVYKLNKDGSGYTVLRSFTFTNGDGSNPIAALAAGRDWALYGTSYSGGDMDFGTVFALRPQPVLLPPILTGGGVTVRFNSMPGSSHRLQRASTLDGSWLTLTSLVVPTSGVAGFTDAASPQPSGFYRVVKP
ncbi:MAG: hypothetical protein L0Z50_33800 [Verrucomicrobiales bacterium]|nr:hypothetical protein [Verrucomicrobiales bacterium]